MPNNSQSRTQKWQKAVRLPANRENTSGFSHYHRTKILDCPAAKMLNVGVVSNTMHLRHAVGPNSQLLLQRPKKGTSNARGMCD